MKNLKKFRINYYGSASLWACDDNERNRKILKQSNIFFWKKTFVAADGTTISRLEWND